MSSPFIGLPYHVYCTTSGERRGRGFGGQAVGPSEDHPRELCSLPGTAPRAMGIGLPGMHCKLVYRRRDQGCQCESGHTEQRSIVSSG
eukprot:6214129-Pleurochrysis_carterae.AAC.2